MNDNRVLKERRYKVVGIDVERFMSDLNAGCSIKLDVVPEDAVCMGMETDSMSRMINLLFYHESFEPVEFNVRPPRINHCRRIDASSSD